MVDTARTSADLLANLFQDGQAAGEITAQDLRDMILSVKPSHGGLSMDTPAATTIAVAGTYYKAAGTTVLDAVLQDFDDGPGMSNRLRYIGAPTRHVQVAASISMTCGGSNQVVGFQLAKNGTVLPNTVAKRKVGTGADIGNMTLLADVNMATDDYFEIWVTNETSTSVVTVEHIHLHAIGHLNG